MQLAEKKGMKKKPSIAVNLSLDNIRVATIF